MTRPTPATPPETTARMGANGDAVSDETKTPADWCEELGARIVDHDGWRGADAPAWHEPITREEFDRRLVRCTIDGRGYPMFYGTPA